MGRVTRAFALRLPCVSRARNFPKGCGMISLFFLLSSLGATGANVGMLEAVQAAYKKAGDVEAGFTQTYVEKLRGRKRAESGRLWAKADGRVRWQYQKPTVKEFIYDGKVAYFYEPENAQVTVFENFRQSKLSTALRLLVGGGALTETFEVRPCEKFCDLAKPGQAVLALWPRQPLAGVHHVLMMIDKSNHRVAMSVLFDPLGNRTEYRFSNVKFHAEIAEANFHFEKPPGVQELRGTSEGLVPAER